MITIDLSQIKNEKDNLSEFLKSRIQVTITVSEDSLILETGEEEPPVKSMKTLLKKFLRHRGLEDRYSVIEKKETYKVVEKNVEQKQQKKQNAEKEGTPPSVYDTLPYFFPR